MERTKLIIIQGPTASGKTGLAIELAQRLGGEIISADSMQVYKYMDIGTAKPTKEERKAAPHHMIDVATPDEDFTAARFRKEAIVCIEGIISRGRVAIVAGGTGLYIKTLTRGLFDGPMADEGLRDELRHEAETYGRQALHERLKAVDPVAASAIHPNNTVRVIRALEVYMLSNRPISEFQSEHSFMEDSYDCLSIGIARERETLYKDIEERVDRMMDNGLLEETERLVKMGYSMDLKALGSLGYKEMCSHLRGETGLEEAVALLKRNTRHYAKRQLTWFRKDPGIKWFSPAEKKDIIELSMRHLN